MARGRVEVTLNLTSDFLGRIESKDDLPVDGLTRVIRIPWIVQCDFTAF